MATQRGECAPCCARAMSASIRPVQDGPRRYGPHLKYIARHGEGNAKGIVDSIVPFAKTYEHPHRIKYGNINGIKHNADIPTCGPAFMFEFTPLANSMGGMELRADLNFIYADMRASNWMRSAFGISASSAAFGRRAIKPRASGRCRSKLQPGGMAVPCPSQGHHRAARAQRHGRLLRGIPLLASAWQRDPERAIRGLHLLLAQQFFMNQKKPSKD